MNYYIECFKKYAVFSGRARRKELFMFFLFNFIVCIVASVLDALFAGGILYLLVLLACFLPGFAVQIRRLHDIGKSGWWYLLCLIPLIGSIILLVWFCYDSQPGDNAYGPNPKNQ